HFFFDELPHRRANFVVAHCRGRHTVRVAGHINGDKSARLAGVTKHPAEIRHNGGPVVRHAKETMEYKDCWKTSCVGLRARNLARDGLNIGQDSLAAAKTPLAHAVSDYPVGLDS